MKRFLSMMLFIAFIVGGLGYLQVISNSHYVTSVSMFLRAWSIQSKVNVIDQKTTEEALRRIVLYKSKIEKDHLLRGMIVNRSLAGDPKSVCDSLLFSALYYTALVKLGLFLEAGEIWLSIEKSQSGGHWYRHPRCRNKGTSRDMILGLLVALSQRPPHYRLHLKSFLSYVERNSGFFSHGPYYLSYLLPGIAEATRLFARIESMKHHQLPSSLREGFSTMEFNALVAKRGYVSHLTALLVWLETELSRPPPNKRLRPFRSRPRSAANSLASLSNPFTLARIDKQRLEYVTQKLVETDPKNLFFKYLRFRVAGALSVSVRESLLRELLSMRAFPAHRLPMNCDRKADYLWQRNSDEYAIYRDKCSETFSGVDFIWMSALLLEGNSGSKPSFSNIDP